VVVRQLLALHDVVEVGPHQVGHQVPVGQEVLVFSESSPHVQLVTVATAVCVCVCVAYTSVNSSRLVAGVNTSSRPITCSRGQRSKTQFLLIV